jgi:hypothetical protein
MTSGCSNTKRQQHSVGRSIPCSLWHLPGLCRYFGLGLVCALRGDGNRRCMAARPDLTRSRVARPSSRSCCCSDTAEAVTHRSHASPRLSAPSRRSAPSPARRNDREHSLITFNPQHGTRADGPHVLALDGKAGVAGFRDRVRGWNAFRTLHANGAEPAKGLGYPRKIGGIGQRSPSRS